MICIYDYLDYQEFLKEYYKQKKTSHFYFSFRYMSGKTGIDPAHIARIMHGKRHISEKLLDKFADLCELDDKQAKYFRALVAFNKSKTEKQSKDNFEKLINVTSVQSKSIRKDQYEFYSKWYYSAVRGLIVIHTFKAKGDFKRIAAMLSPSISVPQVREAVKLLLKLDLIYVTKNNLLKLRDANITTGEEWTSIAVRKFQNETIRLAQESLERHKKELRDISTITVGLSQKDLPEIRKRIAEFRASLINYSSKNENPEDVFQLNVQLFPMTESKKGESK